MKKIYSKPVLYTEEFALNESVADCGDQPITLEFSCFRGPNNDENGVFNSGVVGCSSVPKYWEGVTKVHSSYKDMTFSNVSGVYAYCKKTSSGVYTDSEWERDSSDRTKLNHKKSGWFDSHNTNWHCMAVGAHGSIEEMSMS